MKKGLAFILLTLYCVFKVNGQLLDLPVYRTGPKPVQPTQNICFDYQITYTAESPRGSYQGCFYINSELGLTLGLSPGMMGPSLCEIASNEITFNAFLISLMGNTYLYKTREEKNDDGKKEVVQLVLTGNTEGGEAGVRMQRKKFQKTGPVVQTGYDNITATGYQAVDEPGFKIYVRGNNYPATFTVKYFVGGYGLGYIHTEAGNFEIRQAKVGTTSFEVFRIEHPVSTCFNASTFRIAEQTTIPRVTDETAEAIAKKEAEMERARSSGSRCAEANYRLLEHKKKMLEASRELTQTLQTERIDRASQQGTMRLASMYNPTINFTLMRLEDEYNLCLAEGGSRPDEAKIACLSSRISQWQHAENEAAALETRFAGNPEKLYGERTMLFSRETSRIKSEYSCISGSSGRRPSRIEPGPADERPAAGGSGSCDVTMNPATAERWITSGKLVITGSTMRYNYSTAADTIQFRTMYPCKVLYRGRLYNVVFRERSAGTGYMPINLKQFESNRFFILPQKHFRKFLSSQG